MDLSDRALEARREYYRQYYKKNKDHIREYHKQWRTKNKDKVQAAQIRHWEHKADEMKSKRKSLNHG